jgi:NAD(P)H-nitrite reductase large subunit
MPKTHVIIGASAAGLGAAHRLRFLDDHARIIMVSAEQENPYNKCRVVEYVSGECTRTDITTMTTANAATKHIDLKLGFHVIALDHRNRCITGADGSFISYDALCIATGSTPRRLPIAGIEHVEGIYPFYYLSNVDSIRAYIAAHAVQTAVIVGAGCTGLEVADSLHLQGVRVTIIESAERVISRYTDCTAAAYITRHMHERGIKLYLDTSVVAIEQKGGLLSAVVTSAGSAIPAQLLIYAIGVQPNTQFAQDAGLTTRNGFITVDAYLKTSVTDVWAAGDCALFADRTAPDFMWQTAMQQGSVAAYGMVGQSALFTDRLPILRSAFFGAQFASCGVPNISPTTSPISHDIKITSTTDFYHRLVYQDGTLQSFLLVNNVQVLPRLRQEVDKQ